MKITISKAKWEQIGLAAGWHDIKTAELDLTNPERVGGGVQFPNAKIQENANNMGIILEAVIAKLQGLLALSGTLQLNDPKIQDGVGAIKAEVVEFGNTLETEFDEMAMGTATDTKSIFGYISAINSRLNTMLGAMESLIVNNNRQQMMLVLRSYIKDMQTAQQALYRLAKGKSEMAPNIKTFEETGRIAKKKQTLKLSENQWKAIGDKAGWMKQAETTHPCSGCGAEVPKNLKTCDKCREKGKARKHIEKDKEMKTERSKKERSGEE